MTNAQKEQLVQEALELAENGINVHVPKKTVVALFGAVVVANVTTVLMMGAITRAAKKRGFIKKDDTPDNEAIVVEPT